MARNAKPVSRRAAEGPFAVFLALSADYRETLNAIGETVDKSSGRALQKVGLGLLVGEILFRFVASLSVVEVQARLRRVGLPLEPGGRACPGRWRSVNSVI